MERAALLKTLKRVAPALSNKTFLPILAYFCSDGKSVTAYDDVVALKTPCELGFSGAVPGERLLALLESSRSSAVECLVEKEEILFKLGRTKARFPLLPPTSFLFKEPSRKGVSLDLDAEVQNGISLAGRSAGQDSAFPSRLGITLAFSKRRLTIYASDNTTLVRVIVPHRVPDLAGKNLILLPRFYDLLLKLGESTALILTELGDIIGVADGMELFGKALSGADPDQFGSVFEKLKLDEVIKAKVPATLSHCLERAVITSKESTEFSYADGRLSLFTKDASCEMRDSVKVDLGEEPVKVKTGAGFLLRYIDLAESIGITPQCIILEGAGFQALISVASDS